MCMEEVGFKVGNFIKEKVQGGQQWKVMNDNGIWYEILNCQKRVMLFHRKAHKHWKLVAEDDTIQPPKKKRTYKLRKKEH